MTTPLSRLNRHRRGYRLGIEPLEERRLLAVCDPVADGEVTRDDVAMLAANFGVIDGGTERNGDCNGDGDVNVLDIGVLQGAFGVRSLDFGDAPDRTYPTLTASDGARHVVRDGFQLGASIDRDANGQGGLPANGDDTDADGDDEDGVFFSSTPTPGEFENVLVHASAAGFLDAWADWNRDGDWDDAGEQVFASRPLAVGSNSLDYSVPITAIADTARPTYARFRFSSTGGLTPRGLAADGEVEDYELFALDAESMPPPTRHTFEWDIQAELESATEEGSMLSVEASGPATIELSPAINTDNGMPFGLGGPDTLPPGSWQIDAELLASDLTGTFFPTETVFPTETITPDFGQVMWPIGPIPEFGTIMLRSLTDGAWQIDSFFDISYEIEFAETRGRMAIRPQDGSTHVESHGRVASAGLVDWLPRALETEISDGEVDESLVGVNPPHAVWGYLGGLATHIPRLDWGDAPSGPYPTLAASNGARHVMRNGYSMGPTIDHDANGQPHVIAEGDDGDADGDDENGVVLTSAVAPGGVTTVDVTAVGGKGYLNAWADFNRNGVWEASEQIFTSKLLSMGVNSLSFPVPAATIPEAAGIPPVVSRWRFSRQEVLGTTGLSSSGEVEDHLLRIGQPPTMDFGDAPAVYRTLSAQGGAAHTVLPGAHLGRLVDTDTDGQPDLAALADDANGGADDEDGVTFLTPLTPGGVAGVKVEASVPGRLDAFVDFNHDGAWGGEQVFASLPLAAGDNTLEFSVPASAAGGRTYARFRFSRAGGLGPAGTAPDGEVEDYVVHVEPAAEGRTTLQHHQSDLEFVRGSVQFVPPTFIEVELSDQAWTQVLVPGTEALAGELGQPAVPILRRLVAIPHGAKVSARSVRTIEGYQQDLGEVFETHGLLPYQPAAIDEVTLLEDYPSELFDNPTTLTIDESAYAMDAMFPRQAVSFVPLGKLRDLEVGVLEIAAGQYNPVQKRLTLFERVDWEIGFTGGDRYFLPKEAKNPFENALSIYEGVLNSEAVASHYEPGDFQLAPCGQADVGEELLILTHPEFRSAADTLAAWKEQKGIVTSVMEVGAGTADDTAEEIHELIEFRFNHCTIRPSYVMLMGDAEFIPPWYRQVGAAAANANQDVDNGQWNLLGTVNFSADGGETIEVTRLERTGDEPHSGRTVADAVRLVKVGTGQEAIFDNDDPGFSVTGDWNTSAAVDEFGATSVYTSVEEATATWSLTNLPGPGLYEVHAWWSAETPNGGKFYRDTRARYVIRSANTGTDIPYAYLADDFFNLFPDVAIARAPVDTLDQAMTVVNKTIEYEQTPPGSIGDSSFYEHATVAAAFEGYRGDDPSGRDIKAFVEGSETARNTLMAEGYTVNRIYGLIEKGNLDQGPPERYYNGALLPADLRASSSFPWNGSPQNVIDSFNDGRFLVIHRDHAGAKGWGAPGFNRDHVRNELTNGELTPFVYSINCSSGNFDNETSGSMFGTVPEQSYFSERLLRENDGGVGVIAAMRVTNTVSNTALIRGLVDATFPNNLPNYGGVTRIRRLGDILNYGKAYTFDVVGVPTSFGAVEATSAVQTMFFFHAFGDPTLELWTGNPHHGFLPAIIDYLLKEDKTIHVTYAAAGAKLTAYQDVDGRLMPRGRVTVDERGDAVMTTLDLDPRLPVVFAACRDDAVCVTPTSRRRVGGSPEAPAAVVASAVAGRGSAVAGHISAAAPLSARRVAAIPTAVDHVLSRTEADASQASRSLRVLRASRRAVGDRLVEAGASLALRVGVAD
jgi:hypothetical protein